MAILESLVVKIRGDSRSLATAVGTGKRALAGLGGAAKRVTGLISGIGLGVAGLGGLGGLGLGALASKLSSDIDQIGKLAREYGVTTDEIQLLQRAAALGGTSFEVLGRAMRFASRTGAKALRDLQAGKTNEITEAFERLGIGARELAQGLADPVNFLGTLATAIEKIEDPGLRMAAVQDVLGSRSTALASVLGMLSTELGGLRDELAGDLVGPQAIQDVEDLNDAAVRLGGTISNVLRNAFAALAVPLRQSTESFHALIRGFVDARGGAASFGREIAAMALKVIGKLGDVGAAMANFFSFGLRTAAGAFTGGGPAAAPFASGAGSAAVAPAVQDALRGTLREQEVALLEEQNRMLDAIVVNTRTGASVGLVP